MATATATKIDLFKDHASEYAMPRKPVLLDVGKAKYLTIEGSGEPGGPVFQEKIGALYTIAYTIKMTMKFSGGQDYAVSKMEAQWWAGDCGGAFQSTPKEQWRWKLMIRTPEFVGARELKAAAEAALKKGKTVPVNEVKLETIREGKCVQMLHVGPYDREPESIEKMRAAAAEQGYDFHVAHHEIYLSDPRRVAPERLRTILRIPVRQSKP